MLKANILPPSMNQMLIAAGEQAIKARKIRLDHRKAILELDLVIEQIVDTVPGFFSDKTYREMQERKADRAKDPRDI